MSTKIFISLLLIFVSYYHLKADDNSASVFLRSGNDSTFTISNVSNYGILTSNNKTIHYNVIDSVHVKSNILAEHICKLADSSEIISRINYFTVIINQNRAIKREIMTEFSPLTYNSINFFYSDNQLHRYSFSLLCSFWFFKNSIFKIGGAFGEYTNYLQKTAWNFNAGLGYKKEISSIQVQAFLNYLVLLNPSNSRITNDERGVASLGAELLLQKTMSKIFLINIGTEYFFKKDFLINGKGLINSIGFGIQL
jgi:hypothetical protein